MADYNFYGFYVATKTGKTGLTVTCTVYGPGGVEANAQSATEVGGGLYKYTHTDAVAGDYIAVFATADATVDAQHVPALATKQLSAYIDAAVSGVPASVWAVATSTLTVAGTIGKYIMDLIAGVWAYATRTLTAATVNVSTTSTGAALSQVRGDDWSISLTGLGAMTGYTKAWMTVKRSASNDDSAAILQWEKTGGLLYLNGATATGTDGTLVVTDEATGAMTITLKAAASAQLSPTTYSYDVQMLVGAVVTTLAEGKLTVTADITKAVS